VEGFDLLVGRTNLLLAEFTLRAYPAPQGVPLKAALQGLRRKGLFPDLIIIDD